MLPDRGMGFTAGCGNSPLGFSYEARIISIGVVIILAVTIDSLRT